jgi:dTDP-4-amino-4,6-dideoxygalactose transaminase
MNIPLLDLKEQYLSIKPEIDDAIQSVVNSTAFVRGEFVERFEREFGNLVEADYCIGCGNGTDAIYVALKALGIGVGDEVITTAMSWIATSEAITRTGAHVVFVDVDEASYNINVTKIEEKITLKTKAVIVVHLYGQAAEMTKITEIARANNLFVIEDCAQAHLAKHDGKIVGGLGDFGTFSFYPGKNLGAFGDAGAIVTGDKDLAELARRYANHGALSKHDHKIEGINSRLDGLQAAILSVKMKYLIKWNEERVARAHFYNSGLENQKNIKVPIVVKGSTHVYHQYVISTYNRTTVKAALESEGISTAIHYPSALPFLEAYQYLKHRPTDFPVAFNLQAKILSLPIFPELSFEEVDKVVTVIKRSSHSLN